MAVTLSASNFARSAFTVGASSTTIQLPTDVPSGAAILVAMVLPNGETTTLTSIADDVNGTWTSPQIDSLDNGEEATDYRTIVALKTSSAQLTGASNRLLTVNISASRNWSAVGGWISATGALTLDAIATALSIESNTTSWTTNNVTTSAAGCVIACAGFVNTITESPASYSTGDTTLKGYATDEYESKAMMWGRTTGSASTYNSAATLTNSNYGNLHLIALKEAAGTPIAAIAAYYRMLRDA